MIKLRLFSIAAVSIAALSLTLASDAAEAQSNSAPHAVLPLEPRARTGAPNVLLVLIDDAGFAASSTFGGPIPTPNYEALAANGLRYNRFHTTAMCSSTRAALLTGRNHHRVGMGTVMNLADGEPGYTSVIPKSAATLGRTLQLNGYSTAWFGKNHITPSWEITPTGPFDRWPNGLGFDYFYGFMDGATDQWHPSLVENHRFIEAPAIPDYILDKDLANHALTWLQQHHSIDPKRPFFVYWAPGTAHAPNQAPKEWIQKFKGQFDKGWDVIRAETFARQKAKGVIPANAELTPRPANIPAWDSLSKAEQEVAARMMEVHAAQLAFFDSQFGRVVEELKREGEWDNTLVMYIDGDNGPSGEGGAHGTIIETLNGNEAGVDYMHSQLENMGGPRSFVNYPPGWAWAMATPFQWTKQIASHLGGIRDGLVVSWPRHIHDQGGLRSQFLHVTDIAPTIYEAVGVKPSQQVDGVKQMSFDGVSFAYTFDQPKAPSRHRSQYFEMVGNRSYYEDGWMASTTPARLPWERKPATDPQQFNWELYNLDQDFTQAHDLAKQNPKKLAELKAKFQQAAQRNQVLPIDNNLVQRMQLSNLRPYTSNGRTHFEYFRTESPLPNEAFPDVKNKAWRLSVEFSLSDLQSSGTLITQGGFGNGWGVFLFNGQPTFIYKLVDLPGEVTKLSTANGLQAGKHRLQLQVTPDSNKPGAGATVTLRVDDQASVSTHLRATVPNTFMAESVGVGRDFGTPLVDDYQLPFRFTGDMRAVIIDLDDAQ